MDTYSVMNIIHLLCMILHIISGTTLVPIWKESILLFYMELMACTHDSLDFGGAYALYYW